MSSRIFSLAPPLAAAIVACLLLLGCGDSARPPAVLGGGVTPIPDPVPTPAGKLRFIVLGDTGCGASPPCSSAGQTGNVAKVVEKVCALRGCDFALLAGDNLYESGAATTSDPTFDSAFRTPYAKLKFPFLVTLGNHDNANTPVGEGNTNIKGDVEVAYHYSTDNVDKKWVMPSRYYQYAVPQTGTPLLEFFVLDTSPISHFSDDPNPAWSGAALQTYIAAQMSFINDGLANSKAKWKFALAHHPYVSNGGHGNAGNFDVGASPDPCSVPGVSSATCRGGSYKTFLENTICNKADVLFTGHDHELYWLMPTAACGKTEFILSGAGSKSRASADKARNPVFYQADNTFGFFWVEVDATSFRAAAYKMLANGTADPVDTAGNPMPSYERSFSKP